ncbi:hypothetical protein GCM10027347_23690 [Larkinella harenae]
MTYSPSLLRYGHNEPLPEPRILRAGPLTMLYDNGFLRYIRLGDHEVLRLIYHAVRDHNWATATHRIENEVVELGDNSFRINYTCFCQYETAALRWQCEITGDPDGTIQFTIDGEALSEFQRNRAGFCVLHPIPECAGQVCTLTHPDGSQSAALFPETISPHQPFLNIREMQWPTVNGGAAVLWFVGDIFETEDQRNWTDASYKTYSTPLSKPFPVMLRPGDTIQQSVELRLVSPDVSLPSSPLHSTETILSVDTTALPLPAIGTSSNHKPLTALLVERLKKVNFQHLRAEVNFQKPSWPETFQKAVEDANLLGVKLELVLVFNQLPNYELYTFLKEPVDSALISSVLLVSNFAKTTPVSLVDQVVSPIRQAFPAATIGVGTNAFFVNLNRETPPIDGVDFMAYAISPQAHAVDNLTLMENTTAQRDTVRDARRWIPEVHVSPVTLRPRFNPDAKGDDPDQMPFSTDPRQMSLSGAAWTLASLKNLIQAQARSVTYYETVGEQGILQGDIPSAYPDQFRAEAGTVFPLYWIFEAVNRFQGGHVVPTSSSQPFKTDGLLLSKGNVKMLILVNLTNNVQPLSIPVDHPVTARVLDETTFSQACFSPDAFWESAAQPLTPNDVGSLQLELMPFATVFAEWQENVE